MFREKESLLHEGGSERSPLIQNPIIFTRMHDFPMDPYRIGRVQKKQRFQWLVFFGITMLSLFLLVLLVATMVRLADKEIPLPVDPSAPTVIPSFSSTIEMFVNTSISTIMSTTSSTTTTPTIPETNAESTV